MSRIFLCYRNDSVAYARELYSKLVNRFGASDVAIRAHPSTTDYASALEQTVQSCNIVLVLITSRWVNDVDHDGNRRLEDPGDPFRIVLETAFKNSIPVLPIVIEDATLPGVDELPSQLHLLAGLNPVHLDNKNMRSVIYELVRSLDSGVTQVIPHSQSARFIRKVRRSIKWIVPALIVIVMLIVAVVSFGPDILDNLTTGDPEATQDVMTTEESTVTSTLVGATGTPESSAIGETEVVSQEETATPTTEVVPTTQVPSATPVPPTETASPTVEPATTEPTVAPSNTPVILPSATNTQVPPTKVPTATNIPASPTTTPTSTLKPSNTPIIVTVASQTPVNTVVPSATLRVSPAATATSTNTQQSGTQTNDQLVEGCNIVSSGRAVNLRSTPSITAVVVGTVEADQEYGVFERRVIEDDTWYRIQLNNAVTGWVAGRRSGVVYSVGVGSNCDAIPDYQGAESP